MSPHDNPPEFELTITPQLFNRFQAISVHEEYSGEIDDFINKIKSKLFSSSPSTDALTDALFGDFSNIESVTVTLTPDEVESLISTLDSLEERFYGNSQLLPRYTQEAIFSSLDSGIPSIPKSNYFARSSDDLPQIDEIDPETIETVRESAAEAFEDTSPLPEEIVIEWVNQSTSVEPEIIHSIVRELGAGGEQSDSTIDRLENLNNTQSPQ